MNDGASPQFPAATSVRGWRAAGAELQRRTVQVAERATVMLDLTGAEACGDSSQLLAAASTRCLQELRTGRPDPLRRADLAALFAEIQALSDERSERAMAEQARRMADCERGLTRLRELTTTAGLIDGVCDELIRSLGFARTMLARVEHGTWRPWKGNAALLDEAWVADWIEGAIPLDELTIETRMLVQRRPALIRDTAVPGVAPMVHAAGVRSYVAAPIMPGGQVVGFFHADHGRLGRTCDEADRDILWNFAEGFGHLYERTALLEQLQARADQVRRTVVGLTTAVDELSVIGEPTSVLGATGYERSVPRQELAARLGKFTDRELEVLELLVAGARNGEIAQRLAITAGTVKSHVRHVLAKLDVPNRSQAIALYLGVGGIAPNTFEG